MSKEKQIIGIKECIDAVYGADCAYYDVDGFAIANEIYNAGYRKQEWISVEERLPEEHNDYLVAVRYFSTTFVRKQSYSKERGWYGVQDGHYYTEKDVTHWMLLPEPPKMKGGAE